jgi:hypothetical protein
MEPVSEKRKQAGRLAKIIKKEIGTAVRFTKIEYFVIRQKAARAGIKYLLMFGKQLFMQR